MFRPANDKSIFPSGGCTSKKNIFCKYNDAYLAKCSSSNLKVHAQYTYIIPGRKKDLCLLKIIMDVR